MAIHNRFDTSRSMMGRGLLFESGPASRSVDLVEDSSRLDSKVDRKSIQVYKWLI